MTDTAVSMVCLDKYKYMYNRYFCWVSDQWRNNKTVMTKEMMLPMLLTRHTVPHTVRTKCPVYMCAVYAVVKC